MGGAGSKTGPNESLIEEKYGIKPDKIYYMDRCIYYKIERHQFKLGKNVLDKFEKFNNFSKDTDDTPVPPPNCMIIAKN